MGLYHAPLLKRDFRMRRILTRLFSFLVVISLGVGILFFALSGLPQFVPVPEDAVVIGAGDERVASMFVRSYQATYERWDSIVGVPLADGVATITVTPTEDAQKQLQITLALSSTGVEDHMILEATTLAPVRRTFSFPQGGGQSLIFVGNRIQASVRSASGTSTRHDFDYQLRPFEVSVLELPLAALRLAPGSIGRVAWNNMVAPEELWAQFRVLGTTRLELDAGEFDTTVVRLRFYDGRMRDYWLSGEPPYKIRMLSYNRGRALASGWQLESYELLD